MIRWTEYGTVAALVALTACGDNQARSLPADGWQDVPADARIHDGPADAPTPMVRVFGHVEAYGEAQTGMEVVTLEGTPQMTLTDEQGDFYFDAPEGSRLIMQVKERGQMLSMIRGVLAYDHIRPRVFYLLTAEEVTATESALGISFDPNKAIVEVDFRNAEIGGYGATLTTSTNVALMPAFGVALDANEQPQASQVTVAGGNGSTLLLGGLPEGSATFTPIVPERASLPCLPRDANPLPLVAGVVTWFDFECGNGTD